MTTGARRYLERTIPERRREQILNDQSAWANTVALLVDQFEITQGDADLELRTFLASTGADPVAVVEVERGVEQAPVEEAIRAHDFRSIQEDARQRLVDRIIEYQIAMGQLAGENIVSTQTQRIQIRRQAERVVDELNTLTPEFLVGRDASADRDLAELKGRFLEALGDAPEGLTRVGISDASKRNYGKWRGYRDQVIEHLIHTGQIIRSGTSKRGRYYLSGSEPDGIRREDDRVRQVYETIYEKGPMTRSALMNEIGNDSTNGRARVQYILDKLVEDRFIICAIGRRGYPHYEVT